MNCRWKMQVLLLLMTVWVLAGAGSCMADHEGGQIMLRLSYPDAVTGERLPVNGGSVLLCRTDEKYTAAENAAQAENILKTMQLTAVQVLSRKVVNGYVSFGMPPEEGLPDGTYLLRQAGDEEYCFDPFLISIPDEKGNRLITAYPKVVLSADGESSEDEDTQNRERGGQKNGPVKTSTGPRGSLPQTGQNWWPVPVMLFMAAVFIAAGKRRRGGEEKDV